MVGDKIAVDLGGTFLRVAVVKNNKIIRYKKIRTPKQKNKLLKELTSSIEEFISWKVRGIGVAFAGPLEKDTVKNPPNLPLKNFNLKNYLQEKFKKRVEIENDANCVAIAEAKLGCKKKNFIILTLGTGIGGGIIINGELYKGRGMAGEFGHIILDSKKTAENLWQNKKGKIIDLLKRNEKKQLKKTAECLGKAIGSLINVFDPEIVILAGGVRETGSRFLNIVKKETEKYSFIPRKTDIRWSRLSHPGILGASLLVK